MEWIKRENLFIYPNQWQQPAKTEEWVCEYLIKKNLKSNYIEFICFPWATLIDLENRKKKERANILFNILRKLTPKKTIIRATSCQHIDLLRYLDLMKELKITDIFWAHKKINQNYAGGIRLHPLALYPAAYFLEKPIKIKEYKERKYQYSFVGAYDNLGYLSDVRQKIFDLEKNEKSKIVKRKNWHYESYVYKEQINEEKLSQLEITNSKLEMKEYAEIMNDSIYTLCPEGSGCNTIRIWEALMFGSIPILITPDFQWPVDKFKFNNIELGRDFTYNDILKLETHPRQILINNSDIFLENIHDFYIKKNILDLLKKYE